MGGIEWIDPCAMLLGMVFLLNGTDAADIVEGGAFPSGRPYGGRSPEGRRADRRRKILDAGLDLYSSTGYAATTITALCQSANVSVLKFYEEFASQQEVIGTLCAEIGSGAVNDVGVALAGVPATIEDISRAALGAYCRYLLSDPRRARILYVEVVGISAEVERFRLESIKAVADLTISIYETNAINNGGGPVERTPRVRLIGRTLMGACTEGVVACMQDPDANSVDDLIEVLVHLYVAADEVITGTVRGPLPHATDGSASRRSPLAEREAVAPG